MDKHYSDHNGDDTQIYRELKTKRVSGNGGGGRIEKEWVVRKKGKCATQNAHFAIESSILFKIHCKYTYAFNATIFSVHSSHLPLKIVFCIYLSTAANDTSFGVFIVQVN